VHLDADARLAAAVGGAARFLADAAGLESDAIAQLQSAILAACDEAFEHLTEAHPYLDVTLTRFPDRIEVALSYQGEAIPAVGLDTIAGLATQIGSAKSGPGVFAGVDRIQFETRGQETVTLLTKYIREVTPRL
jgi:ABC-type transporter Mla subunit MlaD